jgi:AcrR family transcriptional regulator
MATREKILDTALTLFNKDGTAAVSTNHIAEAAGISPGNLYYHFHNKEEIIRELFQRMYTAWDTELQVSDPNAIQLEDINHIVETNYQIIWRYRFAYRELTALLRQDAELRTGFLAVRQRGFDGFRELLDAFAAAKIIRMPKDPQEIEELQEIIWLISEFWVNNLEMNGRKVNEAEMQRGVNLMLRVLKPYLL